MTDWKPLPLDTPTEFEVKKVTLKKTLEPKKDGDPTPAIVTLGLVAGECAGQAELWIPNVEHLPAEGSKETLIIKPPKQEGWLPGAERPRKGVGGKSGGFKFDPIEEAAKQAMIVAQSARTAALEELRLSHQDGPDTLAEIRKSVDERVVQIVNQAMRLGDRERQAARGRVGK